MKKASKKIFVSSEEDRGVLVKFLKNKTHLSFWGDEADVPKKIVFSNDDILELCIYIIDEIHGGEAETADSSREYVHGLLSQMNIRNGK